MKTIKKLIWGLFYILISCSFFSASTLTDEGMVHTFQSGKILIQSQIDRNHHLVILVKSLTDNAWFEFREINPVRKSQGTKWFLIGDMYVEDTAPICAKWTDIQPLTIKIIPNTVDTITLTGDVVHETENIKILVSPTRAKERISTDKVKEATSNEDINGNSTTLVTAKPTLEGILRKEKINPEKECYVLHIAYKAKGFPEKTPLTITTTLTNGAIIDTKDVIVESDGTVIDSVSRFPYRTGIMMFAKGESIGCELETKDKKLSASTKVVPYPLKVEDKAGHAISLTIIDAAGEYFCFEASGFEPNEKLLMVSKSQTEVARSEINASESGQVMGVLAPAVIGDLSGNASIEIVGKTTSDLKINYKWGKIAFKNDPEAFYKYISHPEI